MCEKRDRKGMYAKARAGLIQGFTGVDDPYEVPQEPEVWLDTSNMSPDESAREIMLYLQQNGYIWSRKSEVGMRKWEVGSKNKDWGLRLKGEN